MEGCGCRAGECCGGDVAARGGSVEAHGGSVEARGGGVEALEKRGGGPCLLRTRINNHNFSLFCGGALRSV